MSETNFDFEKEFLKVYPQLEKLSYRYISQLSTQQREDLFHDSILKILNKRDMFKVDKEYSFVKFKNPNGVMDGGTIISIFKESDGENYAAINTLEGMRIRVNTINLIAIKHQRKGVVSDKMKKRISQEINEYNQSLLSNDSTNIISSKENKGLYTSSNGHKNSQR